MLFQTEKRRLVSIAKCLNGIKNDIYICEDILSPDRKKYTVWAIKDHFLSKKIVDWFENESRPEAAETFSDNGMYCVSFPYAAERSLLLYVCTEDCSFSGLRTLCRQVIFTCMTSKLPGGILYLVLKQNGINISQGRVYLTYQLDLSELSEKSETDNVRLCAKILQDILENTGCTDWSGYELLQKKNKRAQYRSFTELYQDIAFGEKLCKTKGKYRLGLLLKKKLSVVLKIIKILCIVTVIAALAVFLANLCLGENIFMRLFENHFIKIGTESLLQ